MSSSASDFDENEVRSFLKDQISTLKSNYVEFMEELHDAFRQNVGFLRTLERLEPDQDEEEALQAKITALSELIDRYEEQLDKMQEKGEGLGILLRPGMRQFFHQGGTDTIQQDSKTNEGTTEEIEEEGWEMVDAMEDWEMIEMEELFGAGEDLDTARNQRPT